MSIYLGNGHSLVTGIWAKLLKLCEFIYLIFWRKKTHQKTFLFGETAAFWRGPKKTRLDSGPCDVIGAQLKNHKSLNNFVKNGSFWLKIGPVLDLRNTQNISGRDFYFCFFRAFLARFGSFRAQNDPKQPKKARKNQKSKIRA